MVESVLAPVAQIIRDVVGGKTSETLALFLIDKHIENARAQRIVTRRDQIAALVLPAVIAAADAHSRHQLFDDSHLFTNPDEFDSYCIKRAYSIADRAEAKPHG